MSPLPVPFLAAPRRSKGEPTPREQVAPRGAYRSFRTSRPWDAGATGRRSAEACEGRLRAPTRSRDGGKERSGGRNPRKASTRRPLRTAAARARTGNEALESAARVRPHDGGHLRAANDRRAGVPRGIPIAARRTPWRGKPMDAPVPRGAGRDDGARRDGGDQTSDVARRGAGRSRGIRVRRPGTCRRAREPRRGSVVRLPRVRAGGTVRSSRDGPPKGTRAQGGPPCGESRPGGPIP